MSATNYVDKHLSALLKDTGAFFAFNDDQFREKAKPGIPYIALHGGLMCPKANVGEYLRRQKEIHADAIKFDLNENGKDKIIERELYNHEAFYTGDIDDVVDRLKDYGISRSEIQAKFDELSK